MTASEWWTAAADLDERVAKRLGRLRKARAWYLARARIARRMAGLMRKQEQQ